MAPPIPADAQAIVLACSSLALMGERSLKPLTPTEWHGLSESMQRSKLRPRDLLGLSADELQAALGIDEEPAQRLAGLLSRGGQLALELERLSNRGIWIVTRADEDYPDRLKQRLGRTAPPLLFGAGPRASMAMRGIAVVGSRDVDEAGLGFASALGRRCAAQGFAVISGGARGVDITAMNGAIARGGSAVGVTVDPLEKLISRGELRAAIADELLTLVTPFHPAARWHAGNAMRRNRLIYALSEAAVVVASSAEKGGTRSGALENLKAGWVPLHVRDDGSAGNRSLISAGAMALAADDPLDQLDPDQLAREPQTALPSGGDTPAKQELPAQAAETAGSDDAFFTIWPILARHLQEPVGERRVADDLSLELTQARAWLSRAAAEGYVDVKKRPKRYVLRDTSAEQLRIDGS